MPQPALVQAAERPLAAEQGDSPAGGLLGGHRFGKTDPLGVANH
jgi:hypothetical protein